MTPSPGRTLFSLCEGGRFHAVLVRAGLAGGVRGRLVLVAAILAVGWLPLVVLSALDGTVFAGVDVPLVRDLGMWVRFFVVVPVLVLVEPLVDRGLGLALEQFRLSDLIPAEHGVAFEGEVEKAQRAATSDTVELIIVGVALLLPHTAEAVAPSWLAGHTAWLGTSVAGALVPTAAGRWALWLSLPLVEFLLLRWLWRTLAWWRLLWRIARFPLDLAPSHPDRTGGLAFLSSVSRAFVPVFVAVSALASGSLAVQIGIGGRPLTDARVPIAALLVLELVLLMVPQFFFAPVLGRARRRSLRHFEATAGAMARTFEDRWTGPQAEGPEPLLDSNHAGSMADFASVFERVAAMRPVSLSLREVVGIAVPLAVPFAPLLLYEFSAKEILQVVIGMVR